MSTTIAMSDEQVCLALGLPPLTDRQIQHLRRQGQFPPATWIAQRKLVLRVDLEVWLTQQRERSAAQTARLQARGRKAANIRWSRSAA